MSSSTSPVEKLSEEEQRNSREIEMENLIERKDNDLEQGTPLVKPTGSSKGTESISQKLLRPVEEMCNVKVLMRT